jgi:hypothetical protein
MTNSRWGIRAEEDVPEYVKREKDRLVESLEEGWEPFAVTQEHRDYFGNDVIVNVYHLKKLLWN